LNCFKDEFLVLDGVDVRVLDLGVDLEGDWVSAYQTAATLLQSFHQRSVNLDDCLAAVCIVRRT